MNTPPPEKDTPGQELFLGSNTLSILGIRDISEVSIVTPWHRGGAESYITDFIVTSNTEPKHLIAKACVKLMPTATVAEWIARSERLQTYKVKIPEVFAIDAGLIIQEYVPLTFAQAFKDADTANREDLRAKYIETYKKVCEAGFMPRSLHDVRSHGDDVVVVDFGEDLGGVTSADSPALSVLVEAERSFRSLTR